MKSYLLILVCSLLALASARVYPSRNNSADTAGIFLNETFYNGYLPIRNKGSLFYWLFESRGDPENDPLVLWMNGGPGCSSELALFVENGPYLINEEDLTLRSNPYSWNNAANLLFVDQPLGTGYSSANTLETNEHSLGDDFYGFLLEFFDTFPQYKKRPFYITGESYAGHYIPVIGAHLIKKNNPDINLVAVAIGNGWVDPYTQSRSNAKFSHENGLITDEEFQLADQIYEACQYFVRKSKFDLAVLSCQEASGVLIGNPARFNYYDIRKPCIGRMCYNFDFLTTFLNREDIQEILGIKDIAWTECSSTVFDALYPFDEMISYSYKVAELLEADVSVLVYSGDKDYICNYMGGEAWTNALEWSGQKGFVELDYTSYESYGEYKSYNGLTFLRVYDSGHMVPMDQPEAAMNMIQRFIDGWEK